MVEALQSQLADGHHQVGVMQGRLDAAQTTNAALQGQLEALRQAEARSLATSRERPAGARASRAAPAAACKTTVRRKRA